MIDVTQSFLDEVYNTSRYVKLRGTLTSAQGVSTTLDEDDFVSGSISRVSKAVGGTNFRIGDTHIDYLEFSLGIRDNKFNNIIGSTVVLEYGIESAEDVYEWCKLGKFYISVSGVVRKTNTIKVTADSMLSKTDKSIASITSGTPYNLANYVCSSCGLELGTTEEEFNSFVNGTLNVLMPSADVYDGIKTYRDLLMWVANLTCTFVTCDIDGKIVFKRYNGVPVWTINPDTVASKEFGDYVMNITNVTMSIDDKSYVVDSEASLDNTLELDENPLLINRVADALRLQALTAIRDELSTVQFTPFKIEFNGNPAIEVGDWITYNGNNYLVTSSVFKYKGKCTLQGVGIYHGNTKKQSSTTRGTGGTGGGGLEAQYKTIRYINSKDIKIKTTKSKVFEFVFEVDGNISPMLTVLVTCDITSEGFIQLFLKYDNVELKPVFNEYMPIGTKSFSFSFPLEQREEAMTHILYGYIVSDGNVEGTISFENVLASVSAWGIASGTIEWDGRIDVSEEIPLFSAEFGNIIIA